MSSSASRKQRAADNKAARKLEREGENIAFEFDFGQGGLTFHGPIITTNITVTADHAKRSQPQACRFLRPFPVGFLSILGLMAAS